MYDMTQIPEITCGDCGVPEGQLHAFFPHCDREVCPFCLLQLLTCPHGPMYQDSCSAVKRLGRIPFYFFPYFCAKCGAEQPAMFCVPEREWQYVVPPTHWDAILCRPCYDYLASLRPALRKTPRKRTKASSVT